MLNRSGSECGCACSCVGLTVVFDAACDLSSGDVEREDDMNVGALSQLAGVCT